MKDLYLVDLAEETGNLFAYWAEKKLDMSKMITLYMQSDYRELIDKRNAKFCTAMWYDMAENFEETSEHKSYDVTLCEWLGYFYTYMQSYTKKSSRDIIKAYPFELMYLKANTLHDLDIELAIKKVIK